MRFGRDATLEAAYAAVPRGCAGHYENFPVASRLLPAPMRPHVAAVYAFARTADDFADEDGYTTDERLRVSTTGTRGCGRRGVAPPPSDPTASRACGGTDPSLVFAALGHTMRTCDLPLGLFEDLLSAFRQDVTVKRYATWADLLDYCRRSANPVGTARAADRRLPEPALDEASDALCTALQLTNFWQDLAIDWRRGRLYVPEAERDAAGARDEDLDAGRITPEWAAALRAARR
jgi:hydroxysqualene synthase